MNTQENEGQNIKRGALRWLLRETVGNLVLIAILFGIVGRLDWWNGWAMSAIYIFWSLGSVLFILPVNPQMLAERSRPQKGAKKWDFTIVSIMGGFTLVTYVLSCLDARFGWSPEIPLGIEIAALIVCVLSYDVLLQWSMVANAYFTAIVRIQTDRKHTVATGGPYRWVRHPGYLGTILFYILTPILLGSLWGLIPSIATGTLLLIRTSLEDKTLQNELPGYKEYTLQTRYRIIPGIW